MPNQKKQVQFLPVDKSLEIEDYQNLLDLALDHNIWINHSCGGMGACTTCRVVVQSSIDELSPRTEEEKLRAQERGFNDSERLACQLKPTAGLIVKIPIEK